MTASCLIGAAKFAYNHGMRMRICLPKAYLPVACLVLLLASVGASAQAPAQTPAQAPENGPGFIVTYVEAPAAKSAALAADVQGYARQIENGPGKPKVTILKEIGRPSRMVVMEQWADLSSPAVAQAGAGLAAKVQPDALAPMDRRVNHPLTPDLAQIASSAFVVLMHVDIGGGAAAAGQTTVQAQRDAVMAAPGAVGYEVAVQDQHTNHFALCEVWKSRAAYEAYTATGPAEDFRGQLAALIGSPFDDRFYERVGPR
jgi:quinol monooxygenase YgiN